jgi:hypothetical protein
MCSSRDLVIVIMVLFILSIAYSWNYVYNILEAG